MRWPHLDRIIRYDLPDGATCSGIGGVEKRIRVPVAISVAERSLCIPRVLVDHVSGRTM